MVADATNGVVAPLICPLSSVLLMTQGERTIGLVPRLRRSDPLRDHFPALPGWADVWRSALRALHLCDFCRVILLQLAAGKSAAPTAAPWHAGAQQGRRDDKEEGNGSIFCKIR